MLKLLLLPEATGELVEIHGWSLTYFGIEAAARYKSLITRAIKDLRKDPSRPGVSRGALLPAHICLYHIRHSRMQPAPPLREVMKPRHFIIFECKSDTLIVHHVIHDSRDLMHLLP